jgi:hypothetical protein
MPQQKILEDEFPLAAPQRTAASTARNLAIIGFWANLNLDDVVERAAMRTFKKRLTRGRNVRRFAPHSHGTPPRCYNTDDTSSVDLGQSDFGRARRASYP